MLDAPAPISRTPAPSARFALLVAELYVGAPVPWTRLPLIVESVIATVDPAVTRTPSCPNVGPDVVGPTVEQLPGSCRSGVALAPPRTYGGGDGVLNAEHWVRPTIWSPVSCAALTRVEAISGGVSFVAESIRTPTRL